MDYYLKKSAHHLLQVTLVLARRFRSLSVQQIAAEAGLPQKETAALLRRLSANGLVSAAVREADCYCLKRNPRLLRFYDLLATMDPVPAHAVTSRNSAEDQFSFAVPFPTEASIHFALKRITVAAVLAQQEAPTAEQKTYGIKSPA